MIDNTKKYQIIYTDPPWYFPNNYGKIGKSKIFRTNIVELFGDLPRIELFARQKVEGWDSIGFDIDGCDIRESLDN